MQGGTGITRHIDKLLTALVPDSAERPKLVHRLDRDTSGVLVIARRASVAAKLGEVFRGRNAVKSYWALTAGVPSRRAGTISRSLVKVAGKRGFEKVVANSEVGKSAVTDYRVIDIAGREVCWLLLKPRTGRTHQLRVHCALMNTPIIGDKKYGGANKISDGSFIRTPCIFMRNQSRFRIQQAAISQFQRLFHQICKRPGISSGLTLT